MIDINTLVGEYAKSNARVAFSDPQLNIFWRSNSLVPNEISLKELVPRPHEKEITLPIRKERMFYCPNRFGVKITPIYSGDAIEHYRLEFYSEEDAELLNGHTPSRVTRANFLGNIRMELGEAIYKMKELLAENAVDEAIEAVQFHILRAIASTANFEEMAVYFGEDVMCETVDLSAKLELLMRHVRNVIPETELKIFCSIEKNLIAVTPFRRLESAFLNLIVNAYMYNNAENKEADIKVFAKGSSVCITVSDNGTDADVELISSLTGYGKASKYERLQIGLYGANEVNGLSIASRLAEDLGGSLRFSHSPTGGLEVRLTIPRCPDFCDKSMLMRQPDYKYHISQFDAANCILSKAADSSIIGKTL